MGTSQQNKFNIRQAENFLKIPQMTFDNAVIETGVFCLDEIILCLSTQTGCNMGCVFCSNTKNCSTQKIRSLSYTEIVKQATNALTQVSVKEKATKNVLFSFMGIGEPFLNYENLTKSITLLGEQYPLSRATVSTTGVSPSLIKSFSKETFPIQTKLHLSLHAPNDSLRKQLLPCSAKIKPTLKAMELFARRSETTPKLNYLLLNNINDSNEQAEELASLLATKPFCLKLSELNSINSLKRSSDERFKHFEEVLHSNKIETTRFLSDGRIINAGCGQLQASLANKVPKSIMRIS